MGLRGKLSVADFEEFVEDDCGVGWACDHAGLYTSGDHDVIIAARVERVAHIQHFIRFAV